MITIHCQSMPLNFPAYEDFSLSDELMAALTRAENPRYHRADTRYDAAEKQKAELTRLLPS